jgi:GDPmannose 4,6-dehydratase
MPTALITGISGQDGSYLAELLLEQGYRVVGVTRDSARAQMVLQGTGAAAVELYEVQSGDSDTLARVLATIGPDEVYDLAGMSSVGASWADPIASARANALGSALLLEQVRRVRPQARVFQASSCEIFAPLDTALDEYAPERPSSPYGVAKMYARHLVRIYREAFGMFVACGILFNHESPRRGPDFVTRKITRTAARIALGMETELRLGDLELRRDWGFAGDYVRAMWLTLQQSQPDDYVIGTGRAHSVAQFCELAFAIVGLDWREFVTSDQRLFRHGDARLRLANPERARQRLGWVPIVDFAGLVQLMVEADLAAVRDDGMDDGGLYLTR